jgi:hypothetical protein
MVDEVAAAVSEYATLNPNACDVCSNACDNGDVEMAMADEVAVVATVAKLLPA